jgi:hypothetical protein
VGRLSLGARAGQLAGGGFQQEYDDKQHIVGQLVRITSYPLTRILTASRCLQRSTASAYSSLGLVESLPIYTSRLRRSYNCAILVRGMQRGNHANDFSGGVVAVLVDNQAFNTRAATRWWWWNMTLSIQIVHWSCITLTAGSKPYCYARRSSGMKRTHRAS